MTPEARADGIETWTNDIHAGDAAETLREMPEDSAHAVVTDPPYGLAFMGRSWDDFEPKEYQEFCESWARECLRVLRPGGHLLAFSGNQTHHRLFAGVEDAGFEIRDTITWHYGSGFPKALDVSKAIDKSEGAEREVLSTEYKSGGDRVTMNVTGNNGRVSDGASLEGEVKRTAPATDAAKEWDGWKTALKPATEYVVVARAPLGEGTVAENVMEWGTGALNIDGTRIGTEERENTPQGTADGVDYGTKVYEGEVVEGRYPANAVFDGRAARELDRQSGELSAGHHTGEDTRGYGEERDYDGAGSYTSTGGASRYFYTSKASKAERNIGLPDDEQNEHPTVKPIDLMRWLIQLVTREGQVVVDPFVGSGTTLIAADYLGREWIGVEKDEEHADLARRRVGNYDPSEVGEWIDDETVTRAEQATLDKMVAPDGGKP
jgi:site-specific DNA-methyltransferase (adenine-specific)